MNNAIIGLNKIRSLPLLLSFLLTPIATADPTVWLMKINKASAEVDFAGTFVYLHDNEIESMEVARRINNGVMQERLYSLNGAPREIIRGMNKVWCFIPDENVVVHDYRQISESGFPRILPDALDQLGNNYHFSEGAETRIANRTAQQIDVIPNDNYRYGFNLWADQESGLLLRADLVNQNHEVIEQYMFVDIDIGGDISDEQLAPVSDVESLELFGSTVPMAEPVEKSQWTVDWLPDGYSKNKHIRRMSPMDSGEMEHMVFTDGLSTVSVFIKEGRENQSGLSGLSRMGAIHVYRKTIDNYRITVMGEVPAETVKLIAKGLALMH